MPTALPAPDEPRASLVRPVLCATVAALALLYFGPIFLTIIRPGPDEYLDFVQEWLSARNYWSGESIYTSQRVAMARYTGQDIPEFDAELPWNAHPPVAVLIAVPFGRITDYPTAHLLWNLITFPMFVLSAVLIARELGFVACWSSVCVAVALTVSWNALLSQLYQAQLNFVLLLLLTAAWLADRRRYAAAAGAAVGAAAALKLFPGLLLVYFVATRRWRSAAVSVLVGVLLTAVALAVFGPAAFENYVRDVLPSLKVFRGAWSNVSFTGYWTRLGIALGAPAVGAGVAIACQLAVVAAVWVTSRRAADDGARDRAFALAVVGMPLASPVAWSHYFVFLVIPLLLLWRRLPRGASVVVLLAVGAILWLPPRFIPQLVLGSGAYLPPSAAPAPGGMLAAVVAFGPFTYALTVFFLLVAFARLDSPPVAPAGSPR